MEPLRRGEIIEQTPARLLRVKSNTEAAYRQGQSSEPEIDQRDAEIA